jgi:acetylglutamate kinase
VSLAVVKCGGAVADAAAAQILALAAEQQVCVVHGAGPQISAEMERRGLPVRFVGGKRVTDAGALEVVTESLAAVNASLCRALPGSVGLVGVLEAVPVPELGGLGLVGEPLPHAPAEVVAALAAGRIPVVAPLAPGLNVNADDAAAALAVGLGAKRLLFVTDVPGLLLEDEVVGSIEADHADRLLGAGVFEGGIVPKLIAAVRAVRGGVDAHIGETAVLP